MGTLARDIETSWVNIKSVSNNNMFVDICLCTFRCTLILMISAMPYYFIACLLA